MGFLDKYRKKKSVAYQRTHFARDEKGALTFAPFGITSIVIRRAYQLPDESMSVRLTEAYVRQFVIAIALALMIFVVLFLLAPRVGGFGPAYPTAGQVIVSLTFMGLAFVLPSVLPLGTVLYMSRNLPATKRTVRDALAANERLLSTPTQAWVFSGSMVVGVAIIWEEAYRGRSELADEPVVFILVLALGIFMLMLALLGPVVLRLRRLRTENERLEAIVLSRTEELRELNRHKSEFLANMSHELRTPLNAIIGFSEVLIGGMAGPQSAKQKEFCVDIRDSGRHLLSLINDILDLSKVEAGRMELEMARFDLRHAMDNALTLVRGRAEGHAIELETLISEDVDEFEGDERKLKQILLNLLTNAIKFTPEGGTVTLEARRSEDTYVFSVKDTGIGIAPEDQEKAFEEFRQVGVDSARKAEGTGLGLALTRRLVELHGGRISVESAPGLGSTFTFSLPIGRP
jgi:signal transduction histidine kinase